MTDQRQDTSRAWAAGSVVAAAGVLSPGTVVVDAAGRIDDVSPGVAPGARHLGAATVLVPGAVDLHSDAVEKLAEPRPGVRMPFEVAVRALDRRLAGAGVTTAYAALSLAGDEVGLRERAATEELAGALRGLPVPHADHRLHLRVEVTDAASVDTAAVLIGRGGVDLVSVMDHTPGQGQFPTVDRYVSFYQANYGVAEEDLHVRIATKVAVRPDLDARIARIAAAGRACGVPLAWHDPDSIGVIERAARHGAVIAEFPTTAEAAISARPCGLTVAMGAPNLLLRRSTSGNLGAVEALAARAVDILVSDYYPESLWPAALGSGLPLSAAVDLVETAPARAAGLADRGRLAPGLRADLVALRSDGTVLRTILAGRVTA